MSDTRTQFVGEKKPSCALSPASVVTVVDLESCDTRLCAAVGPKFAEVADAGKRLVPPIVDPGVETLRLDTRVFRRSSVALMRAWRSCKSLKPFVFAAWLLPLLTLLTARAVPGEGWLPKRLAVADVVVDPARFRVAVERDRAGIAEPAAGDDVLRLLAGDKAGIDVRATRGEAVVRALGVTLGDWADRLGAAEDFSDR